MHRLVFPPGIAENRSGTTKHSAMEKTGRKNFRATRDPLQKKTAPWFHTTLGSWKVGADSYSLDQYLFVGPRGGGNYFRVGIFAGVHGDEEAGVFAAVRFLHELARN